MSKVRDCSLMTFYLRVGRVSKIAPKIKGYREGQGRFKVKNGQKRGTSLMDVPLENSKIEAWG